MKKESPLEIHKSNIEFLKSTYGELESEALSRVVLNKVFGWDQVILVINSEQIIDKELIGRLDEVLHRLQKEEPVQYILGEADFYGRNFHVNENVLIPRQETESLIQIIKQYRKWSNIKVADIGTGSGCISCTLEKELPCDHAVGYDISPQALEVAIKNASNLRCRVVFQKLDILNEDLPETDLDLIVSNPPYVMNQEKSLMDHNVLQHEPHLALFVDDQTPLIFYEAIATRSKKALKKGGVLFFEINEQFGRQVAELLIAKGYDHIKVHHDIHEKERFVSAELC